MELWRGGQAGASPAVRCPVSGAPERHQNNTKRHEALRRKEADMSFDIERLQKSTRRVTKFLRKNAKRPGSDAIHDLRTKRSKTRNSLCYIRAQLEEAHETHAG